MILQIVNPFDELKQYQPIYTIDSKNKGVLKSELTLTVNQPHQLDIEFSTNLPLSAYNLLAKNNYGIKLVRDDITLLFFQDSSTKKISSEGNVFISFFSKIWGLRQSEPTQVFQFYINQSTYSTVNQFSDFTWQLIGSDINSTVSYGIKNNFDNLNDLREATGVWSYLDAGLKWNGSSWDNQILIGNYNDIDNYGAIDERFATLSLKPKQLFTSPFDDSPVIVNVNQYFNGRQIQFLFVGLDTGAGAGTQNASALFTRTDYDFINPEFPLVEINNRIYIQNTKYNRLGTTYDTYSVTFTANTQSETGEQILDVNSALEYMYRKAVYYLKTQGESVRYDFDVIHKKLTFPKYFQIQYKKTIRNLRGEKYTIFDIDDTKLMKSLTFDLTKLN